MARNKNSIPGRRINPALANMNRVQRDNIMVRANHKAESLISAIVLFDKFGFSKEQVELFDLEREKQLKAYGEGYIEKVADFENVLREEYGYEVKF